MRARRWRRVPWVALGLVAYVGYICARAIDGVVVALVAFAAGWIMDSPTPPGKPTPSSKPVVIVWALIALMGYVVYGSAEGAMGAGAAFLFAALARAAEMRGRAERQRS